MTILELAAIGIVLGVVWIGTRSVSNNPKPRAILRRFRVELWHVRLILDGLPATRAVHDLSAELDRAEHTMSRVEAEMSRP